MSDSELVKEFTEKTGSIIPNKPELMSHKETFFLIKMMLDEILELSATVEEPYSSKRLMIDMINNSKDIPKEKGTDTELISAQADAMIDVMIYMHNAACKKGIDLSKIFKIVHDANMNKRFPDGTFHKREDGKIIKPPGFVEADVTSEIIRQGHKSDKFI
jgi:predicted HAD superfamily Cof-like phosphohydrolase